MEQTAYGLMKQINAIRSKPKPHKKTIGYQQIRHLSWTKCTYYKKQAENVIGEFMASQGIESSDAYRGAEEETRQEGDLPKQYRFFGSKGNIMLGAVDITPELAERLSDETLSEEERGRIISEAEESERLARMEQSGSSAGGRRGKW